MFRFTRSRVLVATAAAVVAAPVGVALFSRPAGAVRPLARAVLHDAAGAEVGTVEFAGSGGHAERIDVELRLPGGAPGLGAFHGVHVHAVGACTAPFTSAGGHWNLASGATHGSHTGDLPSVLVAPDGTGAGRFETHRFDVEQLFDGDGSAVVVHAGPDNFGNVPIAPDRYADPNGWYTATGGTAATGDAGGRYACGVVERS